MSDRLSAGLPHHVSTWLNFFTKHSGREFVAEQIGDAWYSGFLSSELTLEEMFIVGSQLNRYVDAVSQSPFTPLWILQELKECSDERLSTSARISISVRNSAVYPELVARKRKVVKDFYEMQNDRAIDRRNEEEDLDLYEDHKEQTGY